MNVESSAEFALALDDTAVQPALTSSVMGAIVHGIHEPGLVANDNEARPDGAEHDTCVQDSDLDEWLRKTPASTSVIEAIVGGLELEPGPDLVAQRLAVLGIGWPLPSTMSAAELRGHNQRIMAALEGLGIDVGFHTHLSAAVIYARLYERIFVEGLVVPTNGRCSLDLIDLADSGEWQAWLQLTGEEQNSEKEGQS